MTRLDEDRALVRRLGVDRLVAAMVAEGMLSEHVYDGGLGAPAQRHYRTDWFDLDDLDDGPEAA